MFIVSPTPCFMYLAECLLNANVVVFSLFFTILSFCESYAYLFTFSAHLTLLQRTPFNDLSMAFLGYATTIGFFGRPDPFAGFGMVGPLPPAMIVLLQIGYVVFGLLVVIMIECIGDVINGRLLRPKMPPKQ